MKRLIAFILCLFFTTAVCAISTSERRALNVPKANEDDMRQLVHYLTDSEPDKLEQAKAIAVWIASHVAYDNYTYAAGAGKASGHTASSNLERGNQDADTVFKDKIGTCVGYANLYEKMLGFAGIHSQKVTGFVLENIATPTQAKLRVKNHKIGHVWTKIKGVGKRDVLVDITWMSRGQSGNTDKRLTEQMKRKEIRKMNREGKKHTYEIKYFDFDYKTLQKQGEYRFSEKRQLLQK